MTSRIERLGTHHQRAGFDCGEPALNDFLQRQAGQLERRGFGKTYVALRGLNSDVAGFVTVSVGQIQTLQLPTQLKLPRYPAPVFRIGRLAVDQGSQGQGIGHQLVSFALQMALEFSQRAGLYAVVVDAKHANTKRFYDGLGFLATVDDPLCLYLPISLLQMAASTKATQP